MVPSDKITKSLLETVRDDVSMLLATWPAKPVFMPTLLPITTLISMLVMVKVSSINLLLGSLAVSLAVMAGRTSTMLFLRRVRIIAMVTIMSIVIALPAELLYEHFSISLFAIRVSAIVALGISVTSVAGWRSLLQGIQALGISEKVVRSAELTAILIPVYADELVKIAIARRSRTLGRLGIRESWRLAASGIASLIDRVAARSMYINMSMNSRTLGPGRRTPVAKRGYDIVPYLPPLAGLILGVLSLGGIA